MCPTDAEMAADDAADAKQAAKELADEAIAAAQSAPSNGYRVIRFIERFARIRKGRLAGHPVHLNQYQRDILVRLYAVDPETGRPASGRGEAMLELLGLDATFTLDPDVARAMDAWNSVSAGM